MGCHLGLQASPARPAGKSLARCHTATTTSPRPQPTCHILQRSAHEGEGVITPMALSTTTPLHSPVNPNPQFPTPQRRSRNRSPGAPLLLSSRYRRLVPVVVSPLHSSASGLRVPGAASPLLDLRPPLRLSSPPLLSAGRVPSPAHRLLSPSSQVTVSSWYRSCRPRRHATNAHPRP